MKYVETESVELKRTLNDTFEKEVVAYLNSHDGTIYLGVEDNGEICGVDKLDETMKKISDIVSNSISPNPQELIKVRAIYEENKFVIEVAVKKGTSLYYINKYGRSSKGCYIRVGTSCRSMTEEQIEKKYIGSLYVRRPSIKETESSRQDLTFEQFKLLLNFRGVHVNDSAFSNNFNLKNKEGLYNRLAFLLSDQNDVSIKVVRFKGKDKANFISRKEFGNCCLIKAMANSLEYVLDILNIIQTEIKNGVRVDTPYLDVDSFREAWMNAVCHHDWMQETPPAIYAFDDRIEIISHGLLNPDLTLDEFFSGVSKPVNESLAKILTQMHYIEQSGRGIPTIIKKYGKEVFHFGSSFIECKIPYNIVDKNKIRELNGESQEVPNKVPDKVPNKISSIQEKILIEIVGNGRITAKELSKKLNITDRAIRKHLKFLKEQNLIRRVGSNKSGCWIVVD